MAIRQLGYLIFGSSDVKGWQQLAETVIGLAPSQAGDGSLYLKMDDRDYRIAVVEDKSERLVASGWEMASQADFENARARFTQEGIAWHQCNAAELSFRKVRDCIWLPDPAGNRIELYWGPISAFRPFSAPAGIAATFETGDNGLGHVVLPADDLAASQAFFERTLGFELSDTITMQFGPGLVDVNFNHCANARQHSLALAGMPSPNGCVHFNVEVSSLKELGMALDRVEEAGHPLVLTLGQHVNDDCVSFYFLSPHGFMIEIGFGGMLKDWSRHSVFETTRPSHWGHRFVLGQ